MASFYFNDANSEQQARAYHGGHKFVVDGQAAPDGRVAQACKHQRHGGSHLVGSRWSLKCPGVIGLILRFRNPTPTSRAARLYALTDVDGQEAPPDHPLRQVGRPQTARAAHGLTGPVGIALDAGLSREVRMRSGIPGLHGI